jgi:F0F1-type ATP synthase assembly protein I
MVRGNTDARRKRAQAMREVAPYLGLGTALVAPIVAGALIGRWLDVRYDWHPVATVVGSLMGMAIGFYHFLRTALASTPRRPPDDDTPGPQAPHA